MVNKVNVIATVGISLLGGLKRHNISVELPDEEIVKELLRVDHHTICAEVSSTLSFIRDQLTEEEPQDLYLLTSDTPDGKKIGNILKLYFQAFFSPSARVFD